MLKFVIFNAVAIAILLTAALVIDTDKNAKAKRKPMWRQITRGE